MGKIFQSALIVLMVMTAASVMVEPAEAQRSDQAYLIQNFDVDLPELIDIKTSGGFVRVYGEDRSDVRVEMYVKRNDRYLDDTDTSLDDYDIRIDRDGATVFAHASRESGISSWFGRDSRLSISFIVYTPKETKVDARTSGGSLTAENLDGEVLLRTSGGSITMKALEGNVTAKTSGGSINLDGFYGVIDANTSGGGIRVRDAEGDLNFKTSGGSIRLEEIGGKVTAHTSGGSINADLFSVVENVDLRTSGGSITINLPGDRGYDLNLRGSSVNTELRNFSGEVERNRVIGTIAGGGPSITARTSGGTVRINYM